VLAVDTEEVQEIRPHRVQGVGFGNIFESKPISLRQTVEKKPVPEPNHQRPAPEPIKPSMVSNWFPTRLLILHLLKSKVLFAVVTQSKVRVKKRFIISSLSLKCSDMAHV